MLQILLLLGVALMHTALALPFTVLLASVQEEILASHLGPDVARQLLQQPFVVMALEHAMLHHDNLRVRMVTGRISIMRRGRLKAAAARRG